MAGLLLVPRPVWCARRRHRMVLPPLNDAKGERKAAIPPDRLGRDSHRHHSYRLTPDPLIGRWVLLLLVLLHGSLHALYRELLPPRLPLRRVACRHPPHDAPQHVHNTPRRGNPRAELLFRPSLLLQSLLHPALPAERPRLVGPYLRGVPRRDQRPPVVR